MKFFISSSFFNAAELLSFYSHLHRHYLLAPPLNWSKMASEFLQLTNYHIRVEVTGERESIMVLDWTRNTCKIFFYGDAIVTTWVKIA